jgi:hypothetical protein
MYVLYIVVCTFSFGHCVCLFFFDIRIFITPLVSCGHCIVCPLIYGFWLPLWYLVAIVLSVLWHTDSDYPFGILWPLYCMSFDIRILMTPLVSSNFSFNCSFDNKDISIICMYCWTSHFGLFLLRMLITFLFIFRICLEYIVPSLIWKVYIQ